MNIGIDMKITETAEEDNWNISGKLILFIMVLKESSKSSVNYGIDENDYVSFEK